MFRESWLPVYPNNTKRAAREDRPFRIEVTGELVRAPGAQARVPVLLGFSTCRPCRQRRGLRRQLPLPWFLP